MFNFVINKNIIETVRNNFTIPINKKGYYSDDKIIIDLSSYHLSFRLKTYYAYSLNLGLDCQEIDVIPDNFKTTKEAIKFFIEKVKENHLHLVNFAEFREKRIDEILND